MKDCFQADDSVSDTGVALTNQCNFISDAIKWEDNSAVSPSTSETPDAKELNLSDYILQLAGNDSAPLDMSDKSDIN